MEGMPQQHVEEAMDRRKFMVSAFAMAATASGLNKLSYLAPQAAEALSDLNDPSHSSNHVIESEPEPYNPESKEQKPFSITRLNAFKGGKKMAVTSIITHWTAGKYSSPQEFIDVMKRSGLSVHFFVDKQGGIFQLAPMNQKLWHAGFANTGGVGIEIEGGVGGGTTEQAESDLMNNQVQQRAVASLVRYIYIEHDVELINTNPSRNIGLIGHRDVPSNDGKSDPGENYNGLLRRLIFENNIPVASLAGETQVYGVPPIEFFNMQDYPLRNPSRNQVESYLRNIGNAFENHYLLNGKTYGDVIALVGFKESSWDAGQENVNTTDINAQNGTPSRNVMQFIQTTFDLFAPQAYKANPAVAAMIGVERPEDLRWDDWRHQGYVGAGALLNPDNWDDWGNTFFPAMEELGLPTNTIPKHLYQDAA